MVRKKTWKRFLQAVERRIDQPSFPFYVALAAFLDTFVLVIPTDGIVVSSAMARPKRWFVIFMGVGVGSVLSAALLAAVLHYDQEFIRGLAPAIFESRGWAHTEDLVRHYGGWAVFLGGLGLVPPTQPFIIIPILAGMNFTHWLIAFSAARFIKFGVFSWLGSHSPRLLARLKIFRLPLDSDNSVSKDKDTGK